MKKVILIALCFMASFKANSQVIDTTIKGVFAAPLKTPMVFYGEDFKSDTATHFAFIQDATTVTDWTVTVALRSKTENFRVIVLNLKRVEYDAWEGDSQSLLFLLITRFNIFYNTKLQFK